MAPSSKNLINEESTRTSSSGLHCSHLCSGVCSEREGRVMGRGRRKKKIEKKEREEKNNITQVPINKRRKDEMKRTKQQKNENMK